MKKNPSNKVKSSERVAPVQAQPKGKPKEASLLKTKAKSKDVAGGSLKGGSGMKKEDQDPFAFLRRFQQFLKEVAVEFRKISWPDKTQVARETGSVLFLVTVITLMVLGFDWILGHVFFNPLEHWARLHGGGVGRG